MDQPEPPASGTAIGEPAPGTNGTGQARAVVKPATRAMTQKDLAAPVTFKNLSAIFEAVVLPLQDRIVELERACGLAPTATVPGVERIAPTIANYVNERIAPLRRSVHELEQTSMKYMGVYQKEKTYQRGETVTHNGALWFCQETSDTRPGQDGTWKLTVKSGQAPEQKRAD